MDGHEAPPGYTVTRRLGSDASTMFLATEDATGRPVTLRMLGAVPDAVRDRLLAAAPTLRSIDHPHVLPFLDLVAGPSGPVVVLGAAEGGSMAGIIGARGVLPAGEVVTACAPVCEGLTEIHRRGVLHGDLTLDDIVFSLDGRPMVAGVGLVQVGVQLRVGQHARPIPPEVAAGSPPGSAADVYGLATAAMIALTGALPSAQVALPGVAAGAEALLTAGLDANPQRRPNAANLGNAFFAIAEPVPVELVLEESQATTGSLPQVSSAPPDDDIAGYMQRSTSMGRRARRRADSGQQPARPDATAPGNTAASGDATTPAPGPADADPGGAAATGGSAAAARQDESPATGRSAGRRRRGGEGGTRSGAPAGASASPSGASAPASSSGRGASQSGTSGAGETPPAGGAGAAGGAASSSESRRRSRRSGARTTAASGQEKSSASTGRTDPPKDTGDDGSGEPGSRKRSDGVWIVSALVVLLLGAGAVLVGMRLFDDDVRAGPGTGSSPEDSAASTDVCGEPQPAPSTLPPEVTDWTQEVQRLYSLRAQAFEETNPELLCQVHAPSNPVLAEDVALIEEYIDAGVHTEGLAFEVVNAEPLERDGGRITVRITQRIPDYRLVNDDGEVEQENEGTEDTTWEATLVAVADPNGSTSSWRFG
ncbi:protein kinase-like protein [Haloactinopolyspora alba]|uniref:non-specific serine/threonine protein kinase n=1 Tax=Haloactinopolyspora alba TaxID=648780 RepID=A0A2P8DR95_9ACTN|nr:protein kinase [Haloactinopolyspora alba]PSK99742.1 protein kinase-like protein [Haloactinopolyspora alba]